MPRTGRNSTPPAFIPFSQTDLDDDARAAVLATEDAGHEAFRTAIAGDGAPGSVAVWLSAHKMPGTQSWRIIRYERPLGLDGDEAIWSQRTVQKDLCFFDALRYCAHFEAGQITVTAAQPEQDGIPHFKIVARDALVPLDRGGLPHPAAGGIILTDGDFDDNAQALARQTVNFKPVLPGRPAPGHALVLASQALGNPAAEIKAANKEEKNKLQNAFNKKRSAVCNPLNETHYRIKKLKDRLDEIKVVREVIHLYAEKEFGKVCDIDFEAKGLATFLGIISTGMVAIIATGGVAALPLLVVPGVMYGVGGGFLYKGFKNAKAEGQFEKEREYFLSSLDYVHDCHAKKLMENFRRAAIGVFGLEYASHLHQKEGPGNKKGRKILETTIAEMKLPPEQAQGLKDSYAGKDFPAPGSFLALLDQLYVQLEAEVDAEIIRILRAEEQRPLLQLPPPTP